MAKLETSIQGVLERTLADKFGEDEQLWAFLCTFEEELTFPLDAQVVGQPVELLGVIYDGNPRRGLIAIGKRNGGRYNLSLLDVTVSDSSPAAPYIAAYRNWVIAGRSALA